MSTLPPSILSRAVCYKSRHDWLAARTTTLGASEAAMILGQHPTRGPWDVWVAKHNRTELDEDDEEQDPNDPCVRGQILEPAIRVMLAMDLRVDVVAPGAPLGDPDGTVIVHHPVHPWATCSPDGWVLDDGATVPPELKTDRKRGWEWGISGSDVRDYLVGGIPADRPAVPIHHWIQVQHQLDVLGLPYGYLCVFLGSFEFRWFRIHQDPVFGEGLMAHLGRWRQTHLLDGIEPDPDASAACAAHYRAMYAGQQTGIRAAEGTEALLVETFGESRAEEKAACARKDGVKGGLLKTMGPTTCLTLPGGRGVRRDKRGALTPYGFDR